MLFSVAFFVWAFERFRSLPWDESEDPVPELSEGTDLLDSVLLTGFFLDFLVSLESLILDYFVGDLSSLDFFLDLGGGELEAFEDDERDEPDDSLFF